MKYRRLSELIKDLDTDGGKWQLSRQHELSYVSRNLSNARLEKEAIFKSALIAAEPDALIVSVTVQESENRTTTGLLKLIGKWSLDAHNRITFQVKRGMNRFDKLTFEGSWGMNEKLQIVYGYETRTEIEGRGKKRKRVTKNRHELLFQGRWDISEKNCLTYLMAGDSDSAFRVRGAFETKSILAKKGEIRYQLGIGIAGSRKRLEKRAQTLSFFGKWKFSNKFQLSFELENQIGKKQEFVFGIAGNPVAWMSTHFSSQSLSRWIMPDEVSIQLTLRNGQKLGLELVLTKDFFNGDVQAFLRFTQFFQNSAVETGIKFLW